MDGLDRWGPVVLALVAGVIAFEAARWRLGRWLASVRARRRARRARAGEVAAEALLRSQGYDIVARQPERRWQIEVDGRPRDVDLRADLLVARRGRTYVAEVKNGEVAPRLDTAATRRQMLEYRLAYETHGVLLVDMNAGAVHEVVFPVEPVDRAGAARHALLWLALGAALGGALAWWVLGGGP